MNFSPRMNSRIHGFSVVGGLKWKVWNGVVADLWEVRCADGAEGHYTSPDPRLFVALTLKGEGAFAMQTADGAHAVRHAAAPAMSFIPAGLTLHGRAEGIRGLRHLDLHFEEAALGRRFGKALSRDRLHEPRLDLQDDRIAHFAALIAAECAAPEPMHDLYGDGLVNALLALLFEISADRGRRRSALSRAHLRLVTEYIESRCFEAIKLGDLAALVSMSETHFSHAFKASTGVPPHRWQIQARIRRVQGMLSRSHLPLTEAAALSGFSDQAHFTRVFKSVVGMTPAAWLRMQGVRRP